MTIRELAANWIQHADEMPTEIDLDTARTYISWMDPESDLPEGLTPEAFMEAWNDLLHSDPPEDIWHPAN